MHNYRPILNFWQPSSFLIVHEKTTCQLPAGFLIFLSSLPPSLWLFPSLQIHSFNLPFLPTMVSTRSGGRRTKTQKNDAGKHEKKSDLCVKHRQKRKGSSLQVQVAAEAAAVYEEKRAQRMKENVERMKKLGILDLSKQLQKSAKPTTHKRLKPSPSSSSLQASPPRRSSR